MSKGKGTEDRLNELHGKLTEAFIEVVEETEDNYVRNEYGEYEKKGTRRVASSTMLAAAAKFLKDNEITTDVTVDEDMNHLKEVLSKKQKHSRLKNAGDAANDLDLLQ